MTTHYQRVLLQKPRHELANMVIEHAEEIARLRKELTLERNTNVHLKAAISERA